MKTFSALRSGLWLVAVAGLGKAVTGCGSDFTCVEDLSCQPGVTPDGGPGGTGATGGTAGASGGATGSAGATGAAGSAGTQGEGGSEGDAQPDSDAGADAPGPAADSGSDAGPDAPSCETEQPNQALGIFVSRSGSDGGDGGTCGAIGSPCATIKKALGFATAGKVVYLEAGTYEEDGIALSAEVTLQGGWARRMDGSWRHVCGGEGASNTVIRAKSADRTLIAVDLEGVATLESLTVRSKSAAPLPGASVYGIFATGAKTGLLLRDVAIEVGAAGAGATGVNGTDGGQVPAACPAGTGQDGAALGMAGTGAPNSMFDATGFLPAPGIDGGRGSSGTNGTAAPAPPCGTCPHELAACKGSCPSNPCQNVVCAWTNLVTTCGGPGTSGCGGEGGGGGRPGGGGGSSLGVFLWNATIAIESGRITAGAGGNGGPGGKGGSGGLGTPGLPGSAVYCSGCGRVSELSCAVQPNVLSGGLPGGVGGSGRAGGPGGGGSGGHSYAIYKGGSATASIAAGVELTAGAPGSGGGTAPGRGADGAAKPIGP